jgi:hypothetical protein
MTDDQNRHTTKKMATATMVIFDLAVVVVFTRTEQPNRAIVVYKVPGILPVTGRQACLPE